MQEHKPRVYNLEKQKNTRKKLRNEMTRAEIIMWSKLKAKQTGYKFRRQHGVGKFIVDFYCPELKLVVEIDGDSHFLGEKAKKKDAEREAFIKNKV